MENILNLMQKIIDKKNINFLKKQMNKQIGHSMFNSYGSNYLDKNIRDKMTWGICDLYKVFDICYRKLYKGTHLITGLEIEYDVKNERIVYTIKSNRPGFIIGKGGCDIDKLECELHSVLNIPVKVLIKEQKEWFKVIDF